MPVESHMALNEHQIKQLKSHDAFVDLIYKKQFFCSQVRLIIVLLQWSLQKSSET